MDASFPEDPDLVEARARDEPAGQPDPERAGARETFPTAMNDLPILYIKPGCPWCDEVVDFLDEHGVPYQQADITRDDAAREAMRRLSGQNKTPTLDWHGRVLADFGVDELVPFLRARNVKLEDS